MTRSSETQRIALGLVDRTLPKAQWTHEAHLRAGLWHALRHEPSEALALLRQRISTYNVAVGGTNGDHEGYHETITGFYVHVIAHFVRCADRMRDEDDLADELIAQWGARDLPLRFYSRDLLQSTQARRTWMEPDLAPLP